MADPTKTCTRCGEEKPVTDFGKQGKYRRYHCKACAKIENKRTQASMTDEQKARYRKNAAAKRYGLTVEEYDALFDGHERCPGCLATEPGGHGGWHVDHDHATGKVRGLLCTSCNLMLGHAKDNIATLTRLQIYLEVSDGTLS